mgnify:CR=1 FL=1|jgi:hypothetical protein|tara:strand:- start:947 stop:1252 length:306 start_codon:yes stop_codon:yes gene_type:complete
MAKIYCTATNTGKGFITHEEQENALPLNPRGYPGNVWQVEDNATGQAWKTKVGGVTKTLAEAQALVNAEVQAAQAAWDALPDDSYEKEPPRERPHNITITE